MLRWQPQEVFEEALYSENGKVIRKESQTDLAGSR
jgi:hypothetical protein